MSHPAGSEHAAFRTVYDFRSHTRPARAFRVPPPVPFGKYQKYQELLREEVNLLWHAAHKKQEYWPGDARHELEPLAIKMKNLLDPLAQAFPNEEAWQTADKADTESSADEGKIGFLMTYQAGFIKYADALLKGTATLRDVEPWHGLVSFQMASQNQSWAVSSLSLYLNQFAEVGWATIGNIPLEYYANVTNVNTVAYMDTAITHLEALLAQAGCNALEPAHLRDEDADHISDEDADHTSDATEAKAFRPPFPQFHGLGYLGINKAGCSASTTPPDIPADVA